MIEQLRSFGVATGSFLRNLFAKHGVVTEGFIWDYRPEIGRVSFQPHKKLHNTKVTGPNDPALTNLEAFPRGLYYYPGDHNRCKCWLKPRMFRVSLITGQRIEI